MTTPDKPAHGPNALRRAVLILVTALLVARPLVPGEDPGLLELFTTPAGMVLSIFWLLAAVAFATWHFWVGQGAWRVGWVELALTAFAAALLLTSLISASYLRPALLISWEMILVAVVFSLVRNLATEPRDRRGLLAVVLTTAVCAAGFGLYQHINDLPRLHDQGADVSYLQRTLEDRYDVRLDADSPRLAALTDRLRTLTVTSTFTSPRVFACYLTLTLPILLGLILSANAWNGWVVGGLAVLMGIVLGLTFYPVFWAVVILGGLAGLIFAWRRLTLRKRVAALGCLVVTAVIGLAAYFSQHSDDSTTVAAQAAGVQLASEHFWFGVGPGNFSRHFPPSSSFIAWQDAQGPRCLPLDVTTAGGIAAGFLVLVVLGSFCRTFFQRHQSAEEAREPLDDSRIGWEFYVGGMVGLLLAFVVRTIGQPSFEIVREGWAAGVRSLIWFPTIGLILAFLRTTPIRSEILFAGWIACLAALFVSDGVFFPSVAQPLWAVAALAVPATAAPVTGSRLWQRAQTMWAAPVMLGLMILYFITFVPAASSAQSLDWVRVARVVYRDLARTEKEKPHVINLQERINGQLLSATNIDPLNVEPLLMWADWSRELGIIHKSEKYATASADFLARARKLDPLNLELLLLEFEIQLQYARHFEKERKRFLDDAERVLGEIIQRDPAEEALRHFQMAEVCYTVKEAARGRPHAEAALALSKDRLSSSKVQQLRTWLKTP